MNDDAPLVPKAAPWPDDHVLTAFQQAVVDAIAGLRPGDLATYGEIAEEAGYPGSAQAVGNVVRSAPDLPWWRIVPSDGRLYCTHLRTQQPLLEAEGHRIDEHRRVHAGASRSIARFVVQRHRARALHYDVRFEIDGVLVSWAVPKGPTLDPSAKRLAVKVEDHSLGYIDFEGVIGDGQYGGGDVIVWDRGTWELHGADDAGKAVANGELHAEVHGEKLRGRFVLVRTRGGRYASTGDKENWLMFHKRDDDAVDGWDPEDHPLSVISGRTNDEVRGGR